MFCRPIVDAPNTYYGPARHPLTLMSEMASIFSLA